MKKDMLTCIRAMSADDFETLEDIIINKYYKFRDTYWLIREYSDYISRLKYDKKSSKDRLKIEIELVSIDVDKVLDELSNKIDETSGALIRKS